MTEAMTIVLAVGMGLFVLFALVMTVLEWRRR